MSTLEQQQPIRRTVGQRKPREGQPMTAADRALMTQMAQYRTRAPKGVFIYHSREAMQADRLRWLVDSMLEKHRER